MAVLQAWPGRGFWQGTAHGQPGTLTGMVSDMAGTPQPAWLAGWVRGFASFTAAHGFAVNLVAVIALAAIGVVLLGAGLGWPGAGRVLTARRARLLLLGTVGFAIAFCLADWVLIEDIGIFGGLGTDVNSMIPIVLLVLAGYLALTVAPAAVPDANRSRSRLTEPAAARAGARAASGAGPGGAGSGPSGWPGSSARPAPGWC